ncbi:carbohydrate-binding protein with CBM35 doain [Luteibacter rhizovicinus]|uniref:Alpha-galactosidase n=1 Tax=Luteibacter rhizovicinus TaxID=242606 RepID=A0A4R3YM71_9GAMM|nr:CBM35 domain-containing protein [Luteibacter rhizovicinus]TCV93390.1 carbohydrate-binding protein with CBM35 doain [Luteibacter rhizovicinus]
MEDCVFAPHDSNIPAHHVRDGQPSLHRNIRSLFPRSALAFGLLGLASIASAQVNGVAQKPYLGWSSFSQQTIDSEFFTQASMVAQSDALLFSGLQAHGYNYINMDSGWQGSFDVNGRPTPDTVKFPDIKGLIDHIHRNGQKAGIYWIPGVEEPAVLANSPILGTPYHIQDILTVPYTAGNAFGGSGTSPYHYKIDFTKPGAQEYIDSVVALFASWGVDFIKLDGVTPGSYNDDLRIDNRSDVEAWSKAIAKSGRPIWLTVSWAVGQDYLGTWQQFSNARRIDDDVECESRCATLSNWPRIYKRFRDLPAWQNAAGPTLGWNDLDSLDIGDGDLDGLTKDEKRSAMTLWAIANAPLYLGGDLTKIDDFGKKLATNDEVIAVNQSGKPAKQILGGDMQVWVTDLGDGSYNIALFNMNATPTVARLPWNVLGFAGVRQVRDLWAHADLGPSWGEFSTRLEGHGVRLLKVRSSVDRVPPVPSTSYEAESASLAGGAVASGCDGCSGGKKVGGLGLGSGNTVTFNNVYARRSGVYLMRVDSLTLGLRSYLFKVGNGPFQTFNSGGSSFLLPSSSTVPICLQAGYNSIQFGNPTSYPPDLDRIVVSGNGDAALPTGTTYEAEAAKLGGAVTAGFSNYASGLSKAGNIGGGPANTVTFSHITVPTAGTYQLEIDYQTNGVRTLFVSVNGGKSQPLDLNGSSFDDPATTIVRVQLKAGANTIQMGNPSGNAPDLDRIVVAPWFDSGWSLGGTTQTCGRP